MIFNAFYQFYFFYWQLNDTLVIYLQSHLYFIKNNALWTGELVQWLIAVAALAQYPGFISRTHIVAHKRL